MQEPEVVDKGSIVIGGIKARGVVNAIKIARESFDNEERPHLSQDYLDRNVSLKVVKAIEGCVQVVQRDAWYQS